METRLERCNEEPQAKTDRQPLETEKSKTMNFLLELSERIGHADTLNLAQ